MKPCLKIFSHVEVFHPDKSEMSLLLQDLINELSTGQDVGDDGNVVQDSSVREHRGTLNYGVESSLAAAEHLRELHSC